MLNHIGSSVMSYKPSLIVSYFRRADMSHTGRGDAAAATWIFRGDRRLRYSAGQWGGARAAVLLRPALSEMGALPVSAMIHVPKAAEVFDEAGTPREDQEQWASYFDRGASQLEWWGVAAREHKAVVDPFAASPALTTTPLQRNAPQGP